jgi:IS5 family transposase
VDATIISAPSSTKNRTKERDPEMHQTKKGNQWYFGMKAHIGVDSRTKLIHSVAATAANVHDSQVLPDLLHGNAFLGFSIYCLPYGASHVHRISGRHCDAV